MANKWLQPRSVIPPVQTPLEFRPRVLLLEDTTMAGLQAQLENETNLNAVDPANYWVIESIEYQVTPGPGMGKHYSVCIHATQCIEV